jgi:hypothetical protein
MNRSCRIRIHGLFIGWLFALAQPVMAQSLETGGDAYILPPGSMPAWTVPVLRLVSATHVEPTTGIVLSDSGLVLVPEAFAAMGDEIIVLDGGTDIIRNGRPARIEKKFTFEGLQVLFVEGLRRQGVTLAATALQQDDPVLLAAFPPAEQIAEGKPPLSVQATVDVFSENGRPSIPDEAGLPNVTGALVDRCGNLVGVSLADDIQTMESSAATRYQWRDVLVDIFTDMAIPLREFDCSGSQQPEPEPVAEEEVTEEPVPAEPDPPAEEPAVEESPEPEEAEEIVEEEPVPEPQPSEEPLPDSLPPFEDKGSGLGRWLWLLAALVLAVGGYLVHRVRNNRPEVAPPEADDTPAVEIEFEDDAVDSPPPLDSQLVLTGILKDGTEFEDSCEVSERAMNVTIGRGDCDLVIPSPAVSRRHVQLNGSWHELTVSDLGSSNGTSINGVPCLEGEIMYLEPGDALVLGDARCSLEIRARNEGEDD